ncbi:sigma-54-dependent Fis family transcriptional regulator [Fimbriimonadia bacterium ATM]|nr:MAG: sigma-54-dependent Fis family transcriptional regulator [Armatimonadota bacterium]MBC6970310.1 sigma-54-dependent Fis family transcriptional regulator [Armatimonadota bacterium]MCE7899510.1 sigma-54-dependent Fis family transcriptional regulator [Armatimonadetes bacterium ATM1]MDL1927599.1 sigma-54-dependent Fis family transcriptional regulator [Fimbriimonadia bacterium ATM]RIJ96471.1 MAG: two-component system response regulator [Armatimonadota bacterium]
MKEKPRILVVDDEPNIRRILQAALERSGYVVTTAESGEHALELLANTDYTLVISDVLMPGITGVELLKRIKSKKPDVPVLIVTAFGTIPQAVEAIRAGAADYITKPFDLDAMRKHVAYWISQTKKPKSATKPANTPSGLDDIIGESPAMQEVFDLVRRIADSTATVLITGESGTGKERIARAIHKCSTRSDKPFVAVSCAALPETLLESELFGHEKGAFTGADTPKPGRFELADGGTLFLDEIGEVPLSIQVKLLRVLQEREVDRLGGTAPKSVDVRLITATNRDLEAAVSEGVFRQDLLYRLQVLHIELPPLRERTEDVEPLALLFLRKYASANGKPLTAIAPDALDLLKAYRWPGNVRELENVVERAVVLAGPGETRVTADLLPKGIHRAA